MSGTEAGDRRHHVVIIGCGFGGLFAARALKRAPVRITLIDRTNHHLFQPLLYQVATGILSEGQIAPAIRDVLRNYPSLRVILGEVEDIDVEAREVHVDEFGKPLIIGYDSLIVAGGASSSYFGHDEFRELLVRHEVARRRPGAPGQHLRLVRAGRGRKRPRRAPASHDVRRRRGRPDGRGDGRPARASSRGGRSAATTA